MRRKLGAAALELDAASDGAWSAQWRATVAARLPSQHWPQRRGAHHGGRRPHGRTGRVRPAQRSRPGGRRGRQLCQWPSLSSSAAPATSTAAIGGPAKMPIWPPDTGASGAFPAGRPIPGAAGVAHASRRSGRRAPRRRQQGRNHPAGQQCARGIRQQPDGSVQASVGGPGRLRPRRSPRRAAHRVLAVTDEAGPSAGQAAEVPRVTWAGQVDGTDTEDSSPEGLLGCIAGRPAGVAFRPCSLREAHGLPVPAPSDWWPWPASRP